MIRIPLYPLQDEIRGFLRALEAVPKSDYTAMWSTIFGLTGTPQNQVEWLNPDEWIIQRLSGRDREVALKLWEGSGRVVNPRHSHGAYWVVTNYDFTEDGPVYRPNERGWAFLESEDSEPARMLDREEGLAFLLNLLGRSGTATRADLIDEWTIYCQGHSNITKASVFKDYLRRRLNNLEGRGYLEREGMARRITPAGRSYLKALAGSMMLPAEDAADTLQRQVREYNDKIKKDLRAKLSTMPPYAFEKMVRDLLEAMGYDDVSVTSATNDKGVDVVGTVQFGITTVTEVVQVKRHKSNITRPVLDALRGSLYRWKALRGTIITLSDFAKGCKEAALDPGAAPITLINGDRLIELLVEHQIAVEKHPLHYLQIDDSAFESDGDSVELIEDDSKQEA